VVIKTGFRLQTLGFRKIRDSKQLSKKQREEVFEFLIKHPKIECAIGKVSEKMIDKINIQVATELAMIRAIKNLKIQSDFLIIDGNRFNPKKLEVATKGYKLIVKADEKVFSCAAASIVAKVYRDRIMLNYHKKYPQYGFDRHKGYGTKMHLKMIKKYGPCKIHRKSFKPIKNI